MLKAQVGILWVIVLGLIGYLLWKENKPAPTVRYDYQLEPSGQGFNLALPTDLTFCGEAVPMKDPDVIERLDRELHVNVFWHSSTYLILKRANKWFPQVEKILKKNGVPDDFKYLMVIESSLTNAVSSSGATGFWQFLPLTAREFGLEVSKEVDFRYDPIKSTEAACKYLKKAYDKFHNWTLVAASYNMGMRGIQNEMDDQMAGSYYDLLLNEETGRYVFRILALKEIFENQQNYKFFLNEEDLYAPEKVKYVKVKKSIPNLVDFARKYEISYKTLKRLNPWLRKDKLTVRKGDSYEIALPDEGRASVAGKEKRQEASEISRTETQPEEETVEAD